MKQVNFNSVLLAVVISLTGYIGQRIAGKVDKLNDEVVAMIAQQRFDATRIDKMEITVNAAVSHTAELDKDIERLKQRVVLTR